MYCNGVQLGDDLTDNAYDDDGYRFHDAMHLANVAHLGWSPVLRGFLRLKRKRDKKIDEVEDGARAKIVEELVLKLIHAEGVRLAPRDAPPPVRLFPSESHVSFRFVKSLQPIVQNLEVSKNKHWEWRAAIMDGARIFHALSTEGQGTVTVDMEQRKLEFSRHVTAEIRGVVAALGSAMVDKAAGGEALKAALTPEELERCAASSDAEDRTARLLAVKHAIFDALKMDPSPLDRLQELRVAILDDGLISIKATGAVQAAMWKRRVVTFKATLTTAQNIVSCTAVGIADVPAGKG